MESAGRSGERGSTLLKQEGTEGASNQMKQGRPQWKLLAAKPCDTYVRVMEIMEIPYRPNKPEVLHIRVSELF